MNWLTERIGVVRVRQILEDLSHRLAFIPTVLMLLAVVVSQVSLEIDRRIGDADVPVPLSTTVDSASTIFSTIAGGLISAVTLLLSIMLVAVQLASGQFSPRTLRNWLGDPTIRRSVGILLGTTVFCLMGLRSVRDDSSGSDPIVPTVTVLIGVALGVLSLVMMIRTVDHVTRNLQVGSVAQQLVTDTIDIVRAGEGARANEQPTTTPTADIDPSGDESPPDDAVAIEAPVAGWVQQIDEAGLVEALPSGAHLWIAVVHGSYVTSNSPLAHVTCDGDAAHDDLRDAVCRSFALGPTRTMQQDVGFGLQQLTDIAVRALSPGVNDPQTANDIIVNIGEVLNEIWSHPRAASSLERDDVVIHRKAPAHEEHLRAAFDPIRLYGASDPKVMRVLAATVRHLRDEVVRRDLPGPVEPLESFVDELHDLVQTDEWLERERRAFDDRSSKAS
ncbi:MAG: DUF2254 domain-containing protein [Actinomycetota bacterium]